jgi:hypothetical protein
MTECIATGAEDFLPRPSIGVEALLQRGDEPAHEDRVTARAAGHHHDTAPGEFIASLVRLHPGQKLGLIHAQIELDVSLSPRWSRNLQHSPIRLNHVPPSCPRLSRASTSF